MDIKFYFLHLERSQIPPSIAGQMAGLPKNIRDALSIRIEIKARSCLRWKNLFYWILLVNRRGKVNGY